MESPRTSLARPDGSEYEPDVSEGSLTYGGFIQLLQQVGLSPRSIRANHLGIPIGQGSYFSVSRHTVHAENYRAMYLAVSLPRSPLYQTAIPRVGTSVAFKRVKVHDGAYQADISTKGQLYAVCREVWALLHPTLRDHESVIKLQAIIWENGFGAGSESTLPMWPTLVLEYCETTLADFQMNNPPLTTASKTLISMRIGDGLDALHSAEVFHGDLKSENVLIKIGEGGTLVPKLADFGCAVVLQKTDGKRRYWIGGSPMWQAPECPGLFTEVDEMAATDWYSFGLLLLRVGLDGRNPFEELGVISTAWPENTKISAIHSLKETDRLYSLLSEGNGASSPALASFGPQLANFLLRDPVERLKAIEHYLRENLTATSAMFESIQKADAGYEHDASMALLSSAVNKFRILETSSPGSSAGEEETPDYLDLSSLFASAATKSSVPDCVRVLRFYIIHCHGVIYNVARLSRMKREGALNKATRSRLVEEISSILKEYGGSSSPWYCSQCCESIMIDTESDSFTAESLIREVQQYVGNSKQSSHTCLGLLLDTPAEKLQLSQALYGMSSSTISHRKGQAAFQLFLATATGFGTEGNPSRALEILVDAVTSGNSGLCVPLCQYAQFTGLDLPLHLPLRKWLTLYILFFAGIPSDASRVLATFDPILARTVEGARSKLYNGSTASFENLKFNDLQPKSNHDFSVPLDFLQPHPGAPAVQDEMFENTLLHLAAGSENIDTSFLHHCVSVLKIDKDIRNADNVTPLLMACRAGRRANILALLKLNADVALSYTGGETPLHWLGLLKDPAPILEEFKRRGAFIDAQVTQERALPNFIGGFHAFYIRGSPLIWAMAMGSESYVDALLKNGADIYLPGPTGITPIRFACMPRNYRFLEQLSKTPKFRVCQDDAYGLITWSEVDMLRYCVLAEEQERALELILSVPIAFLDQTEVENFYHYLIPEAVSECPAEILEIVLRKLSESMGKVLNADPASVHDSLLPLSSPIWAKHYLAHEAATRGDAKVLRLVLRYGADATSMDGFNRSTLHMLSSSSNDPECVDILIDSGGLPLLDLPTSSGMTAFGNAVANCNFLVADCLLKHTTLTVQHALLSSHPAQGMPLKQLSMFGLFVNWSSALGEKPLEYLFSLPEVESNPDSFFVVEEANKLSALMMASGMMSGGDIYDTGKFASSRRKQAISLLLTKFPLPRHINWRDSHGNTALHIAAFIGCADITAALLESGADPNLVNDVGFGSLDVVFQMDPPYLCGERLSKKMMIETFERGRNDICGMLRDNGVEHKLPLAIEHAWATHLPFPWVREMQAREIEANRGRAESGQT